MKRRGFTIVELLIVITIMGALLILSVANLRGSQISARDSERKTDIETIALSLDRYYISGSDYSANIGRYPSTAFLSSSPTVQVLVVAGGGGGGGGTGGGGGAGGIIYNAAYTVTPQAYSITVGTGGVAGIGRGTLATSGTNSIFDTLTATGGGYGAHDTSDTARAAANGGSGGGSANWGGNRGFGTGIAGQGFNGGSCPTYQGGGGGGGAGAIGQNNQSGVGGNGGDGLSLYSDLLIAANAGVDISGTRWIGGGGGGWSSSSGVGGKGGGGVGDTLNAGSGIANTGSGGGGGGIHAGGIGGNGGSGIVIISYFTSSMSATGGTKTTSGGNTIHKFTSTGNNTFTVNSLTAYNAVYNIGYTLAGIDNKSITAPGITDPALTFISATNNVQTTTGVLPQPTISQYAYQPLKGDGTLCTLDFQECRKFNLYYRLESDNTVYMVTGKNQ